MGNYIHWAAMVSVVAQTSLRATVWDFGPGGSIQGAVDGALAGDQIRVTNGVYAGFYANKAIAIVSRNGPSLTTIYGTVTLGGRAALSGFTVRNGNPNTSVVQCWTGPTNAFLTNCVITGGYVPGGNGADGFGGGVFGCTLYNCVLTGNWASYGGGGAAFSILYNCTVAGNSAKAYGGGTYDCELYNSIVCSNTAFCPDVWGGYGCGTCSTDPRFVDLTNGNLRLLSNSPHINVGDNNLVSGTKDLDGRTRIVDGTVDRGAYEFQPGISGAFIGWLAGNGLRTSGPDDHRDTDHDGFDNWQEWVCLTCPTNPASALRLVSAAPTGSNVAVSWQSTAGVGYVLLRSENLASSAAMVASNIPGQVAITTYTDTTAPATVPLFYRVAVVAP